MRRQILGLGMVLVVAWSALAQAGPLQWKDVSVDAQWVAHVDVDAMHSSDVIQRFYDECIKGRAPAKFFDMVRERCGLDPRKDLHGVTLYSTEIEPGQGVLIVKAKLDKAKLVDKAKQAPNHRSMKYRDYEIHTWTHCKHAKERQLAGALHDQGTLVLASGADRLKSALDVLDGRSDSLQGADTPLAAKLPPGTMFLARATGISASKMADKHPVCAQLERLDYAEGQDKGQWFGHFTIAASDEAAGQRVQAVVEGLRAMLWLHLDSVPEFQRLLDQVKIVRQGAVVRADFQAPVEKLVKAVPPTCELIRKCWAGHAPAADKKPPEKPRHKKAPAVKQEPAGEKKEKAKPSDEPAERPKASRPDRETAGWESGEKAPARPRLPRLLSPRPWLGVRVATGAGPGVAVQAVVPGSPADRAGLEEGDTIIRVEKTRVAAPADLQVAIAGYRPGETVSLVVSRDEARQTIKVELGAFGVWEGESDEPVRELLRRLLEGRFPLSEGS